MQPDPNPGHLIADHGPDAFRALVAALRFDLLLPNAEEGRLLAGAGDPATMVTRLLEVAPLVALTLGAEGCLLAGAPIAAASRPARCAGGRDGRGRRLRGPLRDRLLSQSRPGAAAEAGTAAAARVVVRPGAR